MAGFDPQSAQPEVPAPSFDPTSATPEAAPVEQKSDQGLGFFQGLKIPWDNASMALEAGLKRIGVPTDAINKWYGTPDMATVRQQDIQSIRDAGKQGRKPGLMGNVAGSVLAGVPLTLATRNPWLLGGAMGALSSEAPNIKGAALDTAAGAAMGKAGDVGVKTLGAVVSPVWRKTVTQLLNEGVKLSPGQITGGGLHRVEDAAMSFPIIGDFVRNASDASLKSFNTAAANRALAPLGTKVPPSVKAGHDTVRYVQDALSRTYDGVFNQAQLHYDAPLHQDLVNVVQQARQDLPPEHLNSLMGLIKNRVLDATKRAQTPGTLSNNSMAPISGDAYKLLESDLNAEARAFKPRGGFDSKYADTVNDLKGALHSALIRQNPQIGPTLKAADTGYANLTRLETAAAPAKGGVFSPEALHNAAIQGDRTVRRRASARGDATMQDLATAGRDVLSRTVPDSGTATRLMVNGLTGAALFDRAPNVALNPWALGALGTAVSPYTNTGGKVARAVMTMRPNSAPAVRAAIKKTRVPVSIAGGGYQRTEPEDNQ